MLRQSLTRTCRRPQRDKKAVIATVSWFLSLPPPIALNPPDPHPSEPRDPARLHSLLLWSPAAIAFVFFLWCTFQSDLSRREAREGVPVALMAQGESVWLPKINDERIRTKPPLFYWAGLACSKLLGGVNEITLRLPSVLAGTATVFLTTLMGFWLFTPVTGFLAGAMTATALQFSYLSTNARIDLLFTFFITLALAAFWRMTQDADPEVRNKAAWIAAVALGLALLTKGPLGLLFPLLALFVYSRVNKAWAPWARLLLVPLAMAALWLAAGFVEGGDAFKAMILRETVDRTTGTETVAIHHEPFYYYFLIIFKGLAPWSLFLPVALVWGVKNLDVRWLYPSLCCATLILFLSLFPGKREAYLLPAYPFAMLIIAHALVAPGRAGGVSQGVARTLWLFTGLVGLGGVVFLFLLWLPPETLSAQIQQTGFVHRNDRWVAKFLIRDHYPPAWVFILLALVAFAIAGFLGRALQRGRFLNAWGAMAATTLLVLILAHGPGGRALNAYLSLKPFGQQAAELAGEKPVYHYGTADEDLLFYVAKPVQGLSSQEALRPVLEKPDVFLLVPKAQSEELLKRYPGLEVRLETGEGVLEPHRLIAKTRS